MTIDEFQALIPKIATVNLPGIDAHFKMAPLMRIKLGKNLDVAARNPKKSAVLALLYPNEAQELQMVFMLRKTYKGIHSNQISFPGGKVEDSDNNLLETALRETFEEVGVPANTIKIIAKLTATYIPPSNFLVQPFLGYCTQKPTFVLDAKEVEKLITIPLKFILDDAYVTSKIITTSYAKNIEVPVYKFKEDVIWGATAMLLSEIKELLLLVK